MFCQFFTIIVLKLWKENCARNCRPHYLTRENGARSCRRTTYWKKTVLVAVGHTTYWKKTVLVAVGHTTYWVKMVLVAVGHTTYWEKTVLVAVGLTTIIEKKRCSLLSSSTTYCMHCIWRRRAIPDLKNNEHFSAVRYQTKVKFVQLILTIIQQRLVMNAPDIAYASKTCIEGVTLSTLLFTLYRTELWSGKTRNFTITGPLTSVPRTFMQYLNPSDCYTWVFVGTV